MGVYDDLLKRIVAENRQARSRLKDQTARLIDSMVRDSREDFSKVIDELLADPRDREVHEDDEVLGDDGEAEPPVGSQG